MHENVRANSISEHILAFKRGLAVNTEAELRSILGKPDLELGSSMRKEEYDGVPTEYIFYTHSLVYFDVTPRIQKVFIHINKSGYLDWEFKCRELSNDLTAD